jgi:hypothetical protein
MNLLEMKKKYLSLIEELNPNSDQLTDDPDIAAKQNEVVNMIMFKLARFKKIPKYAEKEVTEGEIVTLEDIGNVCGYDVYQVDLIAGVPYASKASGTVFKFLENGTAEFNVFVYPERITEKTKDKAYEFELSHDALEIMPYGIAADLLKSDQSAEFGKIYADAFERELQRLDPRYQMSGITVSGGWDV